MTNIIRKTTDLAMHISSAYIKPGSVIVDATCGNGHDTLALARTKPSKLYAFDIQNSAVESTRNLLVSSGFYDLLTDGTIDMICDSHTNMHRYISEPADLILFNLGYLPGGDKNITTVESDTKSAVITALDLLKTNGLVCITMYSGHTAGAEEKKMLLQLSETLDSRIYHTAYINFPNQKSTPPEILLITRKI